MIVCFVGTPGSGKSYEAVIRVIDNLRKGREVYAYLDGMEVDTCRELLGVYSGVYGQIDERLHYIEVKFQGQDVMLNGKDTETFFSELPEGAFVVLDEVHKLYGNRDWQTAKNKAFGNYASTHRHHGHDLLLITQDLARVDNAVRSLVEWTYRFRKMNFLGKMGERAYMEYVHGQDDIEAAPLSKKAKKYDHRYFPAYKSYVSQAVKEKRIMTGANVLKHPIFFIIPLVVCFALYMLFAKSSLATGDIFGQKAIAKKAQAVKGEPVKLAKSPQEAIAETKTAEELPQDGSKGAGEGGRARGSAAGSEEKAPVIGNSPAILADPERRDPASLVSEKTFRDQFAKDKRGRAQGELVKNGDRVVGYYVIHE